MAGGDGIKTLVKYKKKVEKIFKIKINIIGFDTGTGLPDTTYKQDLPFFWKKGDYTNQNLSNLEKEFTNVKIYQGNISSTLDKFINNNKKKNWLNHFRFRSLLVNKVIFKQNKWFKK